MTLTPEKIIEILFLEPLPVEGGLFRQTYVSSESISPNVIHHANPLERRYIICSHLTLIPSQRCTGYHRMKSGISIWGIRLSCLSSTLTGRVSKCF